MSLAPHSGAIDQDSVQLRDLERSAKSDQAVYEQLLNRQKELSEISGLTSEDVRIASAAIAPTRTNMPRLPLVLVASGIVGLFAGLGSAFVREAMRRSLVTPLQAQRVLGVDASAILPKRKLNTRIKYALTCLLQGWPSCCLSSLFFGATVSKGKRRTVYWNNKRQI